MEVVFLGTAAAEGWPGLFCECEHCRRAREAGGKNVRTRTSLLVDGIYMVDFPPDNYLHVLRGDLDLTRVEHLFITHAHQDHFYPEDLAMRSEPFAHLSDPKPLHLYGNQKVGQWLCGVDLERAGVVYHQLEPFQTLRAGEAVVRTLLADHDPKTQRSLLYVLELGGKRLFVGFDTGWFPEETWRALEGAEVDLAILDCTNGKLEGRRGHMGIRAVMEAKARMEEIGALKPNSRVVATHFSHNGGLLYEELVEAFSGYGIEVAYDGMRVEA